MKNKIALALAAMMLSTAPCFASAPDAHNNGPTSDRAIFCDDIEDDETSAFVRGNANLYVADGDGYNELGFSIFGNNIQTATWTQRGTGNFGTSAFYFYTYGSLIYLIGFDGFSTSVAKNGSVNWSFDKLRTSLPRNAQVRQIYVFDAGEGSSFSDVVTGLKANSLTPGTLKGPIFDCGGRGK